MRARLTALAVGLMLAAAAPAPAPAELAPAEEARAEALFQEIRCVVCQHESIADSPADMAADMRRLVREQIASGRSDRQVRDALTARYGDYILFRPPFRAGTLLLWLGPLFILLAAGAGLLVAARRPPAEAVPLNAEESRRLGELLESETLRRNPDAGAPNDGR